MIKLSLFSILSGGTGVLISSIDIIMVNDMLGLTETGVYGIAFYFGTIISIPLRSLYRIAMGIVADAFKRNDLDEIRSLYRKSCNSQTAIGLLLFIGIWCNIDNIMLLLPEEYRGGRNVILFVSAGYLIDMGTGINYIIMLTSKYYRFDAYFMIIILLVTIAANYLLIPVFGIAGSAMATALTILLYNLMRWLFIFYKYKMQPYDSNTVRLLLIAMAAFLPGFFMPSLGNIFLDIAVRSTLITAIFVLLMLRTNASPEINQKIRKNLLHFGIRL
jgi:O-antigen/teichoic acid export membrane protein